MDSNVIDEKMNNNYDDRPIGIFDSGLGGISVLSEVHNLIPNEDLIYYGDSINAPYGEKNSDEILDLSIKICDFFMKKNVKAIVIACNTATSVSAKYLREKYQIPIIGMEPAIKPALSNSKKGKVIVMATDVTLREEKFLNLVDNLDDKNRVIKMPCPNLVKDIENKVVSGSLISSHIRNNFDNLEVDISNINSIVLGCTHFVFLRSEIEKYLGKNISIYDGNRGTANYLKKNIKLNKVDENLKGTVEIFNTKSDELIKYSHELFKKEYSRVKNVKYEDQFTEEELLAIKTLEIVNLKLEEILETIVFDEHREKIFKMMYGFDGKPLTAKEISKEVKKPLKAVKEDIKKIEKKVFNFVKDS